MQLQLFHLCNSRSQRIVWLLEELQLDYDLRICQQHKADKNIQLLKQYNPNAKFPTLVIQLYQQHFILTETSAIAEFLHQHFHQLPANDLTTTQMLQFNFWKNFADASLMPNVALKQVFTQIVQQTPLPFRPVSWCFKQAFNSGYLNQSISDQLEQIEQHLSKHEWLVGNIFTIADVLLWFPLQACTFSTSEFSRYPHCQRYLTQIKSRPAFQHALRKGQWSASEFEQYWSKAR